MTTDNTELQLVASIVEAVNSAETYDEQSTKLRALADEAGISFRSIACKASYLARTGKLEAYKVKPTGVNKSGNPIVKKDTLIEGIASALGVSAESLDSLSGVNKNVLQMIAKRLTISDSQ